MKILLVSPYDYSYPSGVNHHVLQLARQFTQMGHEVKMVYPSSRMKQTGEGNIIFIGRPIPIPASGSIVRVPVSPRIFFSEEIAQFLAREDFNIVHLHEPFLPPLVAGFLWRSRSATIGTFHATRSRSWAY
ncbi:MAG: glycosyltransferase family 1 protein, partial [Chloroflexi bacterium]